MDSPGQCVVDGAAKGGDAVKLARVTAPVVSTIKHSFYRGQKTFLVQPVGLDGSAEGPPFVATDRVQAGVGDTVLLLQEGSSARGIYGAPKAPVRSVIVGIVDRIDLEEFR